MPVERYILWGWTSRWKTLKGGPITHPLRITSGSLRGCRERQRQFESDYDDALTGIYTPTAAPVALELQVWERNNPSTPT